MNKIDILTLFPKIFESPLRESITRRAIQKKVVQIKIHNLRDYAHDKHKTCDDAPFGGGAGMVLKCEPIFEAVNSLKKKAGTKSSKVILMSPQGKLLTQDLAKKLSKIKHLIIICARYEGVDERIREMLIDEEISIGDFVLSGGEIPALVVVESIIRLLPKAISKSESYIKDSFYNLLLDYPHYTRPRIFRGIKVPEILLSGNHAEIARWRQKKSEEVTGKKRPDLWKKYTKKISYKSQVTGHKFKVKCV